MVSKKQITTITVILTLTLNLILIPASATWLIQKNSYNEKMMILSTKSMRNINEKTVVVPNGKLYYNKGETPDINSRFYPLVATPLAVYYENGEQHIAPLLIKDDVTPSSAVTRFLEVYEPEEILTLPEDDVENLSETLAAMFWSQTDTLLAIENSDEGYEMGLMATPIASYLNIPVIIGTPDSNLIKDLGCKYIILIGSRINPPSGVSYMRLVGREAITSYVLQLMKIRFHNVSYVVMTNPLDAKPIQVINKTELLNVTGFDKAKPFGQCHQIEPTSMFTYTVPDGNQVIKLHLTFDLQSKDEEYATPTGEGFHILFFDQNHVDSNASPLTDNSSLFYTDTNAYDHGEAYYEIDICNQPGDYHVKIWAYGKQDKNWNLLITSEEIDTNIRPQAPYLSSLAPYLASCRKGVVVADHVFSRNIAGKTGDIHRRFDVTLNEAALEAACDDNLYADHVLDETFEMMKTQGLYDSYLKNTPYLGILADNNMLPMYYYPSETPRQHYSFEGLRQPSDNLLADVDGDGYNLSCGLELAVGRIMGWDAQDVSALLARTLFYNDLIDKFPGLRKTEWKNSATMVMGLALQERVIAGSRIKYMQTKNLFKKHGYAVSCMTNRFYRVKNIEKLFEDMMHSNLIWNEGHGRYYRYEYFFPPALTRFYSKMFLKLFYPQKQQSQYAVCNVKDMKLGPSTMGICACTAGLNDGVPLRCTVIMATFHAGCNALFVNTRCPSGPMSNLGAIVNLLLKSETCFYYDDLLHSWFKEIVSNDESVGLACRNAKNFFAKHYSNSLLWNILVKVNPNEYGRACEEFVHYNLYGDPAFNPS